MYTAKKIDGNKYEIKIEVAASEWEKYVEEAYEKNKEKFNIQGFRKGKAPRKVIEKNHGESVFYDDALDTLFSTEYNSALNAERQIEPIANPEIKLDKFDETGVHITAVVEVMPEVTLGEYKGLKLEKSKGEVTSLQIENEITQVRERQARYVEADRDARNGDFVVINFAGSVDGVKFEGGSAENYRLQLGSHTFIEGFEDQIIGMKLGEVKNVNVTFPEDYQAENLKGKPAVFEVVLNKVEEKQLPELNDEFASNVSEFETFEEYKADVKKHLEESLQNKLKREDENKIIEAVSKASTVEIPSVLVERQLDAFMQDLNMRLGYQGIKLEDYAKYMNTTVDAIREERKENAKETVKTRLVLEAIVKAENISVTEEEVDLKLAEMASKYKKSLEDYKKSMGANNVMYVENDILMNKLLKILMENNTLA